MGSGGSFPWYSGESRGQGRPRLHSSGHRQLEGAMCAAFDPLPTFFVTMCLYCLLCHLASRRFNRFTYISLYFAHGASFYAKLCDYFAVLSIFFVGCVCVFIEIQNAFFFYLDIVHMLLP